MKDHYDHTVDPRDLTKEFNRIRKSHSTPIDGDHVSRLPRLSPAGTSSSDTSSIRRKSATMSTISSYGMQVSHLSFFDQRSGSSLRESKVSAEVRRGEFSKPGFGDIEKWRRESSESAKSVPEFQYYGRHANAWLFGNWSFSDSVKKGWGKVCRKGH